MIKCNEFVITLLKIYCAPALIPRIFRQWGQQKTLLIENQPLLTSINLSTFFSQKGQIGVISLLSILTAILFPLFIFYNIKVTYRLEATAERRLGGLILVCFIFIIYNSSHKQDILFLLLGLSFHRQDIQFRN